MTFRCKPCKFWEHILFMLLLSLFVHFILVSVWWSNLYIYRHFWLSSNLPATSKFMDRRTFISWKASTHCHRASLSTNWLLFPLRLWNPGHLKWKEKDHSTATYNGMDVLQPWKQCSRANGRVGFISLVWLCFFVGMRAIALASFFVIMLFGKLKSFQIC